MCQGCIVSLVKFKVGKKVKSITLAGVGSHSALLSDNKKRLERAGWKENANGERVISIESDFSGWNRFTVESGDPNKQELRLLKSAYKKVAGSSQALIRHIRKTGKIDDALVQLLSDEARKKFDEDTATLRKKFNEDYAPLCKKFDEDYATLRKKFNEDAAPLCKKFDEDYATLCKKFNEDTAPLCKKFNEDAAPLWCKFFSVKSNRVPQLQ